MTVSKWHGGKGDALRSGFDHKAYAENFDRIFKKHDKCGTEECCGKCDTADKPVINSTSK
jgi:hypothetical protein